MGEKEWDPSDVFDVFGDSLARRILVLASDRPLSADELADQFGSFWKGLDESDAEAVIEQDLATNQDSTDSGTTDG